MNRPDELSAALRQLPAPEPSGDLLPRILRSRTMGVRVKLLTARFSVPWGWVAAAAVLTLFIGGSWKLSAFFSDFRESRVGARDPIGEMLRGMRWRSAEVPREPVFGTPEPKYPLILGESLDLSRLSEGLWTYRSTTTTDGILSEPSFNGGDRIRMSRASHDGQPAWLVTNSSRPHTQAWGPFADTAYIDAATLRPRYAVSYWNKNNRTRLVETYSGGRAFQSITITGPMESYYDGNMELRFPSDAMFVNGWSLIQFRVLAPAIPFAKGWHGSFYQTGFFARSGPSSINPRAAPVDLRVTGTDRVSVPAGRFDCWRVEVRSYLGETEWTMWVSREKGWVVKVEYKWSDYVRDDVLESYEPGN